MKILPLYLTIISLLCTGLCIAQVKDGVRDDFPIQITEDYYRARKWERFDKPDFGSLYSYYPKNVVTIEGIPCGTQFTLTAKGELYGFILAQDFELKGTLLPKNSRFEPYVRNNRMDDYMIYLPEDTKIQGYMVRHKGSFMQDYHVDFYKHGALKGFKPTTDIVIDGIPCRGGKKNSWISLFPDKKLQSCFLSRDFEIENKSYNKGSQLTFNAKGNVTINY
jgi:hypothetical protein